MFYLVKFLPKLGNRKYFEFSIASKVAFLFVRTALSSGTRSNTVRR